MAEQAPKRRRRKRADELELTQRGPAFQEGPRGELFGDERLPHEALALLALSLGAFGGRLAALQPEQRAVLHETFPEGYTLTVFEDQLGHLLLGLGDPDPERAKTTDERFNQAMARASRQRQPTVTSVRAGRA